jgi:aminoglycoside phosphotransferase (APT) family kinase protein
VADEIVDVRRGDELDADALERHLRAALPLPDAPLVLRQFGAGRANLTYLAAFGDLELVVRRPPRGTIAPGAHDMAREHRVLTHLAPVYTRAPRALHFCDDATVIGAPFVVLERRVGVVIRDRIPDDLARHDDVARRVDLALIDAAADLHRIDLSASGLDPLGTGEGFGSRQVDGWLARWTRAARGHATRAMDDVAGRLRARLPEPPRRSVVHNDLKLDNCQFQPHDPDVVTSVFDWDMGTVGDPLFDLGLLIVSMQSSPTWVLADDTAIERYASRSGIDVTHIDWYLAFATWRTAVVLQQLHNRWLDGDSSDERYRDFGDHVQTFVARADALLR